MKFVKENLTLVICGAVIVVALAFAFAPAVPFMASSLDEGVRQELTDRDNRRTEVKGLEIPLSLPGMPDVKGVPPQSYIDAKNALIDAMRKQKEEVDRAAQQGNMANRYDERSKEPLLPLPGGARRMPRYLPTVTGDRMGFKELMMEMYKQWTGLLTQDAPVAVDTANTVPPRDAEIRAAWEARKQTPGVGAVAAGGFTQDTEGLLREEKRQVIDRARSSRMYVEPTAFQTRTWFVGVNPPTDEEVFNGFVESWFQSDVVKAIVAVNREALGNQSPKDVGRSAVKRLSRIVVGTAARTRALNSAPGAAVGGGLGAGGTGVIADPGVVFLTSSNANAGLGPGAAPGMTPVAVQPGGGGGGPAVAPDAPAAQNEIKWELGMTGRSAGADYDVVPMSVIMDIDPAYLNKFIDQLCRQNMSYTVTNIQLKTVDPLDRTSNGYLYGDGQVIEVELQIEGILFRSWTQPLMPPAVKSYLGIAPKV